MLRIPAGAPRVVRVGKVSPSSGSVTLPSITSKQSLITKRGMTRQKTAAAKLQRVLLLIERPRSFERSPSQIRVTPPTKNRPGKVSVLAGSRAEIAAKSSHHPTDRKDSKGRQKAGGHSSTLPGRRLSARQLRTLAANTGSAQRFDLAAGYVTGRPVKK